MARTPTEMDWKNKELDKWLGEPTWDTWRSEVLEDGTVITTSF